ncbi:T9SS type A sorting domain-containing protein, partial [bacterium]|nr:T9SS type A sorting domain-containing protein [bacterium]
AGVCALVLSIDPTLTPAEVETLLVHGCDDIYPQNPSFAYGILGHGRVNAFMTILQISHYLSFYSMTLTDIGNGDGRADPGETVELSIVVQNHPEAQIAEGITGMLVCDDEAVTVTSGSVSYGSVLPGDIGFNSTPYTFTVDATDPHWTEFRVIFTDTYGSEQDVSFELELGRPEILVVDDDGGENYQSLYTLTFDSLDTFVDVWTQTDAAISAEELMRYDAVVWLNGNAASTLDNDEQTALATYMDAGKALFFSSKSAGLDIGSTAFYSDYLHAAFVSDDAGMVFSAKGAEGCPFITPDDSLLFVGGSGAGNFQSCDVISPMTGAQSVVTYASSSDVGGVYYTGDYNLIYFAFPFETVTYTPNYMNRQTLLANVMDWLMTVGVKPVPGQGKPLEFALSSVYPNPFNPVVTISYQQAAYSSVKLQIYDIAGKLVDTLVEGSYPAGYYQVTFNGTGLASGLYLARLAAGENVQTAKMVLLK